MHPDNSYINSRLARLKPDVSGIVFMLPYRVPVVLFVIPILWTLIGFTAALQLSVKQDTALIVATLAALVGRRYPLKPEEAVVVI